MIQRKLTHMMLCLKAARLIRITFILGEQVFMKIHITAHLQSKGHPVALLLYRTTQAELEHLIQEILYRLLLGYYYKLEEAEAGAVELAPWVRTSLVGVVEQEVLYSPY